VSKLPDVRNLLDKQGDMMNAASAAGEAVATQIGAIADAKRDAAKKAAEQAAIDGNAELAAQYKAEAASWDEGGTYRVAMHTAGGALIAGLGGGSALGGAAGAGVASALAGKLNQMADSFETNGGAGTDPGLTAGNIAVNLIAGGIGGLVGGNSGAVTASNADLYNRNSTNAEGNGGTGSEFIDRTKSADAGAWNGLVSIAEMGVNLPNGGPFASPGDTGYISLDSARLPYTAGDQIGPDVAFWTAVLATRGVGKGAAAEAEAGAIQFGKVDNQISHTFRHIEAAGFDREVV
jgi:filamentous hemagglutinin